MDEIRIGRRIFRGGLLDNIERSRYSGYTDLMGIEMRHDLSQKWDAGIHAHQLHSWNSEVKNYGLGASLGYKIMNNAWAAESELPLEFGDRDAIGVAQHHLCALNLSRRRRPRSSQLFERGPLPRRQH